MKTSERLDFSVAIWWHSWPIPDFPWSLFWKKMVPEVFANTCDHGGKEERRLCFWFRTLLFRVVINFKITKKESRDVFKPLWFTVFLKLYGCIFWKNLMTQQCLSIHSWQWKQECPSESPLLFRCLYLRCHWDIISLITPSRFIVPKSKDIMQETEYAFHSK